MEEGRSWETSILVPIASTWSIACSNCKGAWKMWLTECLEEGSACDYLAGCNGTGHSIATHLESPDLSVTQAFLQTNCRTLGVSSSWGPGDPICTVATATVTSLPLVP
jgi:hypothetical protein